MHQRRTKKPFFASRTDLAEANQHQMDLDIIKDAVADGHPRHSEPRNVRQQALRLWLSWNEADEKKTSNRFTSSKPLQTVDHPLARISHTVGSEK